MPTEFKSLPSPSSLSSLTLMPRSSMRTEANEGELKSLPLSPSITSTSISTEDDPCHTHFAPDPPLLSLIDFSLVNPNVKVFNLSGISVPPKFLNLLGLGFPFIPSNPIFSKDSAFDTLHHVCDKLYKESIPRPDYLFRVLAFTTFVFD